jgi:gamma-glutamyltranspeptidase
VLEQIVNGIDFGMNPAEAASQLRFTTSGRPTSCASKKASRPTRSSC